MICNGRRKILTDVNYIDSANIRIVLADAMLKHTQNRAEIEYLYNYYKGITPIYRKTKEVRENINHKINVNRAYEIVSFKLGYGFGEPIKYVSRADGSGDDIEELNTYMDLNDKLRKDTELAMWGFICGVGYRLVLPSSEIDCDIPFEIYTLHPATTFVIYYNDVKQKPLAAVTYVEDSNRRKKYTIYTEDKIFNIDYNEQITESDNVVGIPIIEYPMNEARLGVFEPVIDLLNAISEVESNRLDDVEQFVNSFLAILGGQIDEETYNVLNEYKTICLPEGVDAKYLAVAMQQGDMQVLCDSLYQTVLTIVGMPDRKASIGDARGTAVMLNNGWSNSEAQAKTNEQFFKSSERKFLRIALAICKAYSKFDLPLKEIDVKFSRHNTENIVAKTQALATMMNSNISPRVAIATSELWSDPNDVWNDSKEYIENGIKAAQRETEREVAPADEPNNEQVETGTEPVSES